MPPPGTRMPGGPGLSRTNSVDQSQARLPLMDQSGSRISTSEPLGGVRVSADHYGEYIRWFFTGCSRKVLFFKFRSTHPSLSDQQNTSVQSFLICYFWQPARCWRWYHQCYRNDRKKVPIISCPFRKWKLLTSSFVRASLPSFGSWLFLVVLTANYFGHFSPHFLYSKKKPSICIVVSKYWT